MNNQQQGQSYNPNRVEIRSDHGRLILYSFEALEVEAGFDLFLRLSPVAGVLLEALAVLKQMDDDGPLMQLLGPWVSEGFSAALGDDQSEGEKPSPGEAISSLLDAGLPSLLRAIGELAGSGISSVPAAFAAALRKEGGSQLIKDLLATAHRFDPQTKEGGRVSEGNNFNKFYRRNFGEAIRACFAVARYNFGPMLRLGK